MSNKKSNYKIDPILETFIRFLYIKNTIIYDISRGMFEHNSIYNKPIKSFEKAIRILQIKKPSEAVIRVKFYYNDHAWSYHYINVYIDSNNVLQCDNFRLTADLQSLYKEAEFLHNIQLL